MNARMWKVALRQNEQYVIEENKTTETVKKKKNWFVDFDSGVFPES